MMRGAPLVLTMVGLLLGSSGLALGAEVSGRIALPELCAVSVSPVIVRLEPLEKRSAASETLPAAFIDQRAMRFEPRVVALRAGQAVRFGNADSEVHDVHIRGQDLDFNQVVPPGGTVEFVPSRVGVLKVGCDVHKHMRAYLVVAGSPWFATCGGDGAFRLRDVPRGKYRLIAWQEMAQPLEVNVEVGDQSLDLGPLVVREGANPATADDRAQICETGCEPWPMVIDRISLTLAESLEAARRRDTNPQAVTLAQDAYYRDFEASGMKKAVRLYLGQQRAAAIDDLFREITRETEGVVEGKTDPAEVLGPTRQAVLQLAQAAGALNREGVTERSRIFAGTSPAFWVEESAPKPALGRNSESMRTLDERAERGWLQRGGATVLVLSAAVLGLVPLVVYLVRGSPLKPEHRLRTVGLLALYALIGFLWLRGTPLALDLGWRRPARREISRSNPAPAVHLAQATPPQAVAVPRENPIGREVTRNQMTIAAAWLPAANLAGQPRPEPNAVHLVAHVHGAAGNPYGFARGEWIPYLSIGYTIERDGRPAIKGALRPLAAGDGPRYGANITLPGPGTYRLTYRIEPPPADLFGRQVDPAAGVAPWWNPFSLSFPWVYHRR